MKPCAIPNCGGEGVRIPERGETQCKRCGWFTTDAAWDVIPRAAVTRAAPHSDDEVVAFVRLAVEGTQDALRLQARGDPAARRTMEGAMLTLHRAQEQFLKAQQLTMVG